MEWYWAFALLLGMIVAMLALGFPVALAFVTTNVLGWLFFTGFNPESTLQVVSNSTILISRFTLGPVPMFIMMGSLFFHTGLAIRVFDGLDVLFGRLPGRLCYLTVAGGALFATLTGSSMANTAMLGSLMVPEMRRRGYSAQMSMGPVHGQRQPRHDHSAIGARRAAGGDRQHRRRAIADRRIHPGLPARRAVRGDDLAAALVQPVRRAGLRRRARAVGA